MQKPAKLLYSFMLFHFLLSPFHARAREDLTGYHIACFKASENVQCAHYKTYFQALESLHRYFLENNTDSFMQQQAELFYEMHSFKSEKCKKIVHQISAIKTEIAPFQGTSDSISTNFFLLKKIIKGELLYHFSFARLTHTFNKHLKEYIAYIQRMQNEMPNYIILWDKINYVNGLTSNMLRGFQVPLL